MTTLDLACHISSWLSLEDAALNMRLCRVWFEAVTHRLTSSFGAHRLLALYFEDWTSFVALMATRHILLTGNPVVDLFAEVSVRPHQGSLEILVEGPMGRDVHTLVELQGYHELDLITGHNSLLPPTFEMPPAFGGMQYYPRNVDYVSRFVRPADDATDCRVIDIVYTSDTPVLTILRYQNTRMSFLSWNRGYCPFGIATLHEKRGLDLKRHFDGDEDEDDEAVPATIDISPFLDVPGIPSRRDIQWGSLGPRQRWIGDAATFVVKLPLPPMPDVAESSSTYDLSANMFRLSLARLDGASRFRRGSLWIPQMNVMPITHRSLGGWSYAASPEFFAHVMNYITERSRAHGMFWRYGIGSGTVSRRMPQLRRSFAADPTLHKAGYLEVPEDEMDDSDSDTDPTETYADMVAN